MSITRVFKSGNSQAVRIPKELQFERTDMDVEIIRQGNMLIIKPLPRKLTGLAQKFAAFSPEFMEQAREANEQSERETL
jgi:antitoxin VapB